jgi:threonylcarbamoyladenosine tRNA methylthiotransferase MtaB
MNFSGKKAAFHTLGCKLNFSETSTISKLMVEKGFEKVEFDQEADVYIINTCSVTENADRECRQIVKNVLRKTPNAFIAVTGCYAQLKPNEISNIEGVDVVLGAKDKFRLLEYINSLEKNITAEVRHCEINEANIFTSSYSSGDRTRTFLKVQDGCNYSCSFCTIPLARGTSRSDSIENVLANVKKIASEGTKEIVLTGVNLGDFGYGEDIDAGNKKRKQFTFFDLIKRLDEVEGIDRFRISSIEPNLLSDEIIEFVGNSKKFVPHFHIPLQSGSDKILKLMKRRYLSELYSSRVEKIKKLMPHCCIGVDVIVGFPGETEEDFMVTYNFLSQIDVSYLHVFTYSERDNTPAASMLNQVAQQEKKRRNKMLRILSEKKLRAFYEENTGKKFKVLFENENKDGFIYGYTENYLKIKYPYNSNLCNTLKEVQILGLENFGNLSVELLEETAPPL